MGCNYNGPLHLEIYIGLNGEQKLDPGKITGLRCFEKAVPCRVDHHESQENQKTSHSQHRYGLDTFPERCHLDTPPIVNS
jgi:hypothetical protein